MNALLIAHELACAALFFSVFCRMLKTSTRTRVLVRLAFWLLGIVAMAGMAWPILGWPLPWFGVALCLAIVFLQSVTAFYWSRGVPRQFIKGDAAYAQPDHQHPA